MVLVYIIAFTLFGSIVSLIGSWFLIFRKNITQSFSNWLISFAAGALLAVAFFDLLPEAASESNGANIFLPTLLGFVAFFFAERFIRSFHHHHEHGEKPTAPLILIGDGAHNFIDGVAIAIGFLTNFNVGLTTTIAVAAHEIPQELADMGILLASGFSKTKALLYNFASALTALIGALAAFYFGQVVEGFLYFLLALTAGHFIYIAASDLVPELHERIQEDKRFVQVGMFLLGLLVVYLFTYFELK